ncbi:MAG: hypothetical protein HC849_26390 [Oscillatoriales cyanobacterium RU_3_3]|nr:hypothetical protein [Microcoleus sp. SU_5_6]NJL66098.1 hypothetical protein [Microcoleus sp. SM1_3_4]NJM62915.1 hypothetical protein [Oscillatoriales cyanobacterium RU_3_3]NJR25092.1 hypothetical protein [Richelia sp. CSU_2_1]
MFCNLTNCKIAPILIKTLLSTVNSQAPILIKTLLLTVNCQLSTVNSQLSTLNSQLSTVNYQLSTVNLAVNSRLRVHSRQQLAFN